MTASPNPVRALVLSLSLMLVPTAAFASLPGKPRALLVPLPSTERVVIGVLIDSFKRQGQNGQITFNYSPAIRDGSATSEYRDDLMIQFVADPRFGMTGIPSGDFEGGLHLELAHLTVDTALGLVSDVLSGPLAVSFDNRVNFRKAMIVINWPRPEDGDLVAFGQKIEAMWDKVNLARGTGRSADIVMTMDAAVASNESAHEASTTTCNLVLGVLQP